MKIRHLYPLVATRRMDTRGLLAFAKASAERDARTTFPDSETGATPLPFEQVLAGHVDARAERIGQGFAYARLRSYERVVDVGEVVSRLSTERAAAEERVAEADAEHRTALDAVRIAPDRRRRFAHLSSAPLTRAEVLAVITFAEAVALKPTLDGLGAPFLHTYLLVAAIVFASLLLAGHLARHAKDERILADERRAGRQVRASGGTFLSPAVVMGLAVLVVANVFLAVVRASTFVAEIALLGEYGAAVDVGFGVALGLFLSLQALFTAAAAGCEFHAHDPLAAAVRRAAARRRRTQAALRRVRRRVARAAAEARAAADAVPATEAAYLALYREERARLEIVRDSYRADLVARCDTDRAAALAAAPRQVWPTPPWVRELEKVAAERAQALAAEARGAEPVIVPTQPRDSVQAAGGVQVTGGVQPAHGVRPSANGVAPARSGGDSNEKGSSS